MKTAVTVACFILLSLKCYSQTYGELITKAFNDLENKNERSLEKTYLQLFPAYLKELSEEYQKAVSAASTGNKTQAFELLNKLVADSALLDEVKHDNFFTPLHKDVRWGGLLAKIRQIEKGYNKPARKALLRIHDSDQGIRLLVLEAYTQYGKESEEAGEVRSIMKKIDDKNAAKIQEILHKYGWLGTNKVGYFGNQAYFLAIQHVDDAVVQQKYLPIMRQAVKEGNAEPWQYAMLQDRILMNQGKFQIYGTQKIISDDPAKSYIIPLQDPDHVDSLRAEVGLGPLEEDLKEEGMTWDLEEYKKRLPETQKMYRERFLKMKAERDTKN